MGLGYALAIFSVRFARGVASKLGLHLEKLQREIMHQVPHRNPTNIIRYNN